MRIEVDKDLAQLLDQVKAKEPSVYGRGHVETVRFLADYYHKRQPLEALLVEIRRASTGFMESLDVNLQMSLERVFPKAFANFIANLMTTGRRLDAQPPQTPGDPAAREPKERR